MLTHSLHTSFCKSEILRGVDGLLPMMASLCMSVHTFFPVMLIGIEACVHLES